MLSLDRVAPLGLAMTFNGNRAGGSPTPPNSPLCPNIYPR
jgi:hypothetical protein